MDIRKDKIETLLDTRFIKVFDLQYKEGAHYYDATRRNLDDILFTKSDSQFQAAVPDGVNCFLTIKVADEPEKLILQREYRYPVGRFILSPPAGLIDKEDSGATHPAIEAAKREVFEEIGIKVNDSDEIRLENPMVLSSPGLTDESNALVSIRLKRDSMPDFTDANATGGELFDGFCLIDKETAAKLVSEGKDEYGNYFSAYTYMALMWFLQK